LDYLVVVLIVVDFMFGGYIVDVVGWMVNWVDLVIVVAVEKVLSFMDVKE